MKFEPSPQQAILRGCLQGPALSRVPTTPWSAASSVGAGESGCQSLLATSHGHSGTCKLPEPLPQPHRDQPPQRWRVWPGRGPGGRWCWPGGSPPWKWPCWSGERDVLIKGSNPTPSKTAPAHQALIPSCNRFCQALQWRKVARAESLGPKCSYPLGEVKGSNAQWPEAAEHGEDSESQVVPGGQREKVVFTLALCRGCITLQNMSGVCDQAQDYPVALMWGNRPSLLLSMGV